MRSILDLFQGIGTMFAQSPQIAIARFAELGTVATYPIARAMGLDAGSSAAVSIIGGYVVYFFKKGKFNPTVGIAGVSCVPSTAKVAQKAAAKANPAAFILDYALGANICGVITTAILTGIYIRYLVKTKSLSVPEAVETCSGAEGIILLRLSFV